MITMLSCSTLGDINTELLQLPAYSPPTILPSYSPDPATGEERLDHTPRTRTHPTGTYIKQCGRDSVALSDQDVGASVPVYGRHASISGFVSLEDRETVSEILLKIKGKMEVMISESGSLATTLVHDSYTLWSSHKPSTSTSTCPSAVPFSVSLPTDFRDSDGLPHRLPPTYEVPCAAAPGMFFKTSYILSVTITRTVSKRLRFLSTSKTIPIRFIYAPRTHPWRPIQHSSDFLLDVKRMPEEFRQSVTPLLPRPHISTALPMDLQLFLPTVEIFGLDDIIPFHVQLTGRVSALREFIPLDDTPTLTPPIVGSLIRQITVEINDRTATRQLVIGHAKMSPRPPGPDAHEHEEEAEVSLDWDGEVRCKTDTMVAGFDAGCIRIQDFILIELRPHHASTRSEYVTLRHSHPIKLVTESWVDYSLTRNDPR
ncbi:hypothetical protein MSAN_00852900 [Mycena sanguinolenta]|uniref:Uncharacterized protein n=1 Tax=Mycena sanguinolenta TaxID=230812 RepID=A0A8H6YZL4_9AGAR|nr:hypothetical protein MSAN_00852900 [Mycena sanguinolenta]